MEKYPSWMPCLLLSLFAAFMLPSSIKAQQSEAIDSLDRPNIVVFIADDLGMEDIAPYGNIFVETPNLERFAKESLLFSNAFAASPTCGPSRSSFFTGLFPFRHGAHGNHSAVRENTRSLVQYLMPLGYRVAIAGKLHIGPEEVFAFERISGTNVPEKGFENTPGLHYDLVMDPVNRWLSQQEDDRPFLLIVADHSPHVVWPAESRYLAGDIDIPAVHIDTDPTRRARARYYEDITKMDTNFGKLVGSLDTHALSENTLLVFTADQGPQWPFAKWSLYDDGIQVPLMIRWPDRAMAGSRTGAMVSQVDLLPTFVEIAGGKTPDEIDGMSFLGVIDGTTDAHREMVFASHTGDGLMNRSPARMLRTTRFKYILNLAPENVYHTHMDKATDHDGGREYWNSWVEKARTDRSAAAILQRYHHHPKEELYDVKGDPDEMKNMAQQPQYAEMLEGYRKKMAAWRQQQGDFETGPERPGPAPEGGKRKKALAPYVFLD